MSPPPTDAEAEDTRRVWFTAGRERFFAVPPGQQLPSGQAALSRLGGETMAVNLDAMAEWEVTQEQASDLMGQRIEGLYAGARAVFEGLREMGRRASQLGGDQAPEDAPGGALLDAQLPSTLEQIIGIPAGDLVADPEAVAARFKAFLERKVAETSPTQEPASEAPVEVEVSPAPQLSAGAPPTPGSEAAPEAAGAPVKIELAELLGQLGAKLQVVAQELRDKDAGPPPDNVVPFPVNRQKRPQGEE